MKTNLHHTPQLSMLLNKKMSNKQSANKTSNPLVRLLPLALMASLSVMSLSACQKAENGADETPSTESAPSSGDMTSESQLDPVSETQQVPVVMTEPADGDTAAEATSLSETTSSTDGSATDPSVDATNNETAKANSSASTPAPDPVATSAPGPDPEVAIIGTQISDVDYKNSQGKVLKVIYKTSPKGELQASATLPSGKKVNLSAPADQGNNPTYRSANGKIEIVSHGGGGSVDLVENGKSTKFDAIDAEAEVIPQ